MTGVDKQNVAIPAQPLLPIGKELIDVLYANAVFRIFAIKKFPLGIQNPLYGYQIFQKLYSDTFRSKRKRRENGGVTLISR